jgi:Protein of unknown function (DUF4230)
MGVVTPERERVEPAQPPPSPPPPEQPPRRDIPWGLIVVGIVVALLATGVISFRDLLPSFDNPFRAETVDRSGPAVLRSIEDIGEYRAAAGHFEVVIDLEKDTALPSEILGERLLFVAVGSVDAGVDFSALDEDSVEVSSDRRSATITVPAVHFFDPVLDLDRSHVYDRDEGLLNELGGLFTDEPNYQQELYRLAEDKIGAAARQGSGIGARAEENTRQMLESLLGSLGFTTVIVQFESSA